ncbi:hypothetical protein HIM_08555 [Hirsutella minnesotensis 3608]|uniref:Arrestin C-terminal-like domain-containing protein n=1 Tax=Hirsutella minnesotensis 3608 TaxID=1043627 RepID=A0A0F7ZMJ0_9HYPO|nr:hypothetical protein HIM_08555 [Hirsutella minnesotensis 3608]
MTASPRHGRSRNGNWIISNGGNVFYRADTLIRDPLAAQQSPPSLPAPLIGPRRTRPHAIHIVTYPPGYVPRELRPKPASRSKKAADSLRSRSKKTPKSGRPEDRTGSRRSQLQQSPVLSKLLASFSSRASATPSSSLPAEPRLRQDLTGPAGPTPTGIQIPRSATAYDDAANTDPANNSQYPPARTPSPRIETPSRMQLRPLRHNQQKRYSLPLPQALTALSALRQRDDSANSAGTSVGPIRPSHTTSRSLTINHFASNSSPASPSAVANVFDPMAAPAMAAAYQIGGLGGHANRNSIMSVRSAKTAVSSLVAEVPKPVASGSGVSCSILLAEPNVFLSGFDHDHDGHREGRGGGTALLRGKLHLCVSKNVKIKAVQLKLLGRARTEWPEGIPPLKQEVVEEESLRTQVLTFFNAMNEGWETEYGNQCVYQLRTGSANSSSTNLATLPRVASLKPTPGAHRGALTAKELKRLSLQSVQSRSFGKGDSGIATPTQAKGFKVFYPGTYDYSFELPIDHHQLETTKLQYGSVRWELHATVDRAGAFKPNLHGMKEVSIVRLPDQMSLETTEPISISRQWEDQLHYDIVISGKSFPIGSKIPIAFKLTPLAKVQVHKLKVYVTESIEYWTNDKRVTRKEPGRKILLLEKSAGKPLDSTWASSDITTIRGGEPSASERRSAREVAQQRRAAEAARTRTSVDPLPEPSANILGDLELGLESIWGSTEIEANVQIPTCEMMAKNKDLRLHPDCSWKNVNVYHWIKIVMRISRADPDDPTGTKRRHFEISIDSPFTVLNCRATQANTNLPAYSGPVCQPAPYQAACGCPDAAPVVTGVSPSSSTGTLLVAEAGNDMMPMPPQAAHLHSPSTATPIEMSSPLYTSSAEGSAYHGEPRPIHLLRAPSFDPPAFHADVAPPPAIVIENPDSVVIAPSAATPPPQYDTIIGTPSVDGLADYFSRLADYGYHDGDDSGSDSDELPSRILDRSGRVNVSHPRTPGGRMPSRSMEIARPALTVNLEGLDNRSRDTTIPGLAI